jgi:hypothetical protein
VVGRSTIFVVEGPIDWLSFERDAVALLGKTLTACQRDLIRALVGKGLREVVVALDADAHRDAVMLCDQLTGHVPRVTLLRFEAGDPNDRIAELAGLIDGRRPVELQDRIFNASVLNNSGRLSSPWIARG